MLPDGSPVAGWFETTINRSYFSVWKPSGCDGAWEPLGDSVPTSYPAVVVPTTTGQPVRAYLFRSSPLTLWAEQWDGSAFQPMGGPFTITEPIIHGTPALAADASGNVIMAWDDAGGTLSRVRAARWNGTAWTMLSPATGIFDAPAYGGPQRDISISLAPGGVPVLAWATGSYASLVGRYESGTTWTMLGDTPAASIGTGASNGPALAVDKNGTVFLASTNRIAPSTYRVSVARRDGTGWQQLGGVLATKSWPSDFAMIIDASGAPIVTIAERDPPGNSSLYVYRWVGDSWQTLPSPTAGAPTTSSSMRPVMTLDSTGRVVMGWVYYVSNGVSSYVVARMKL